MKIARISYLKFYYDKRIIYGFEVTYIDISDIPHNLSHIIYEKRDAITRDILDRKSELQNVEISFLKDDYIKKIKGEFQN